MKSSGGTVGVKVNDAVGLVEDTNPLAGVLARHPFVLERLQVLSVLTLAAAKFFV